MGPPELARLLFAALSPFFGTKLALLCYDLKLCENETGLCLGDEDERLLL